MAGRYKSEALWAKWLQIVRGVFFRGGMGIRSRTVLVLIFDAKQNILQILYSVPIKFCIRNNWKHSGCNDNNGASTNKPAIAFGSNYNSCFYEALNMLSKVLHNEYTDLLQMILFTSTTVVGINEGICITHGLFLCRPYLIHVLLLHWI